MAITIDWATRIISVPKADMTLIATTPEEIRGLDVDDFRLDLKAIEASEEGMPHPDTHQHNTTVTVGGVTLARTVEIINGYTVTFENGSYIVSCSGANHNVLDVTNLNNVSVRIANSAGLIEVATTTTGTGTTEEEEPEPPRVNLKPADSPAIHVKPESGVMKSFYPLSTPDGAGEHSWDCTDFLKEAETISTPTVVAADTGLLTISGVTANSAEYVNDDGETVAIGKGILFTMTAVKNYEEPTYVYIKFVGSSGSSRRWKAEVPMALAIEE